MFLKEPEKNCPLINNNGNFQDLNACHWVSAGERNTTTTHQDINVQNNDLEPDVKIARINGLSDRSNSSVTESNGSTPEKVNNYNRDILDNNDECAESKLISKDEEHNTYIDENKRSDDNDNVEISSDNDIELENKKNDEPEDAPFNYEDSDRSYSSADVTPLDGGYDYEVSDSEDSCIQDVNEIRLPRGIHNPNYPGFQHLAYTLQEFSPQISEVYDNAFFSNVYIRCKDEEELLKLTLEEHLNTKANNNNEYTVSKEYDLSDDDEGISTKFNDVDDSEYTRDISSDSAIFDNRETDDSQDLSACLQSSSVSTIDDLNLSSTSGEFQEELTALRHDIYDVIQKPLASTVENVGEVINTVIKHIVDYQNRYDVDVWNTLTQEALQNSTNTETEMEIIDDISLEATYSKSEDEISQENAVSHHIVHDGIMDAKINSADAYITNVKEELFTSPDYEKQIREKTYTQVTENAKVDKEKISDKEIKSHAELSTADDLDGNLNKIKLQKLFNENNDPNQNIDENKKVDLKNGKGQKCDNISIKRRNNKYEKEKNNHAQEAGFDVYNIETAMPFIDLDVIENHLKAAREEERRRRNDREEIRRRLALGSEIEEYHRYGERPGRKPSLQARLQSGMNLQICFMNETASDTDSPSEGETGEVDDEPDDRCKIDEKCLELSNTPLSNNKSKHTSVRKESPNKGAVRPSSLPLNDMARPTISSNPTTRAAFFECQARLQTEARMALAQAKDLAHMQMETERNKRESSPITEMLRNSLQKAGVKLTGDRRRVSRQMLTDMNVAQLQIIVNELHTQIEYLNDSLVKLLIARDELHMGQDSMLVDIEDLTRYLSAKEISIKSNTEENTSASEKEKYYLKAHLPSLSSLLEK